MAATVLTVASIPRYGEGLTDVAWQSADADNTNSFPNDGNTLLLVNNGSGASITVTISAPASPRTVNTALSKTTTVAAGKIAAFGPFKQDTFNSSGSVIVDYSSDTTVTVAPIRFLETSR